VNRATFNLIYNRCSRKLYNYALWLVRNKAACDDIIQTVFIRAWNHEDIPKGDKEVEAWLFMVTRNCCMDYFRKRTRTSQFQLKYAREKPAWSEATAENKLMWELLDNLKEEEKTILYMHLRSGYSYREIGEVIDSSESAVRVKAFRALKKLREFCVKEEV
jgi:RNA polymerase sigma factor (sigma-70 family)